jgi:phosphoribosyl-ATP pyrophosphohydrolase
MSTTTGQLEFLVTLEGIINNRLNNPSESSYTARLAAEGKRKVAKKIGEEAMEVALAAVLETPERLTEEVADLLYHLLVILKIRGIPLGTVIAELENRHTD